MTGLLHCDSPHCPCFSASVDGEVRRSEAAPKTIASVSRTQAVASSRPLQYYGSVRAELERLTHLVFYHASTCDHRSHRAPLPSCPQHLSRCRPHRMPRPHGWVGPSMRLSEVFRAGAFNTRSGVCFTGQITPLLTPLSASRTLS